MSLPQFMRHSFRDLFTVVEDATGTMYLRREFLMNQVAPQLVSHFFQYWLKFHIFRRLEVRPALKPMDLLMAWHRVLRLVQLMALRSQMLRLTTRNRFNLRTILRLRRQSFSRLVPIMLHRHLIKAFRPAFWKIIVMLPMLLIEWKLFKSSFRIGVWR